MKIAFSKYQGAGNDFIVIEDPSCSFTSSYLHHVPKMCHRQLGIGADGVVLLQPSSSCDLKMQILNADGSEPAMCGNATRCLALFALEKGWISKPSFTIETPAGTIHITIDDSQVTSTLQIPQFLKTSALSDTLHPVVIDTGVPHALFLREDLFTLDLPLFAPHIRFHETFAPHGVNVTVWKPGEGDLLYFRTYERGVEGETLACGTAAVAVAALARVSSPEKKSFTLKTQGGFDLRVSFEGNTPKLTGPAVKVFEGIHLFEA